MTPIMKYFQTITQIPHCSKEAQKLFEFFVGFAKAREYSVDIDDVKNILISKGNPTLCLQAHYDMVCMGKAPQIETYEEDGWLKAKDSSLGADNGIALAMMMELMDRGEELEFLLTSDEEIGLIGANNLAFELQSKYMLNLDSEDEAEVYIGCAGGVDISASKQDSYIDGEGQCYEVAVKGLVGGHSGVDIDKDIPSAIKVLGAYLKANEVTQLSSIYAGERHNSIPANAIAIVYSTEALQNADMVKIRLLQETPQILSEGSKVIDMIDAFKHGVHSYNKALNMPYVSINLAIINTDEKGGIVIDTSARAMDTKKLELLATKKINFFKSYGFDISLNDKYPAWKPDVSEFTNLVSKQVESVFGETQMKAIHAGLECGVIAKKYPNIKFASIGPNIRYPHSTREMVELASVEKTFEVVERVIEVVKG
ncbi:MAG: M20/M25/M40 family metallo-hydrolase [Sulfurovum sp.]